MGLSSGPARKFDSEIWFNWEQPAVPLLLDLTFEACGEHFSRAFGLPFFTSVLFYREASEGAGDVRASWLLRTEEGIGLGRLLVDALHLPATRDRMARLFEGSCAALLDCAENMEAVDSTEDGDADLAWVDRFHTAFLRFYSLGAITEPIQWFAEWGMEKIIDGEDGARLRASLFTMEEEPFIFTLERDLLQLAIQRQRGKLDAAAVEQHANDFHWKANNYARVRRLQPQDVETEVEELSAGDPARRLEELESERRAALQRKADAMAEVPARARQLCLLADQFGSGMADRRKAVMNRALAGLDAVARRFASVYDVDFADLAMLSPVELRRFAGDRGRIEAEAEQRRLAYVQTLAPFPLEEEEVSAALQFAGEASVLPNAAAAAVAAGADALQLLDQIDLRMGLFVEGNASDGVVRGDTVEISGCDGETRIRGRCRVVSDPIGQRHEFRSGEILLASSTTPDFVPIMRKAAAVVTNMGGLLQHAAHFAREEGKPCIVGTGFATSAFVSGQEIELDLLGGEVRASDAPSPGRHGQGKA
jgi:phosphohistidine swiveling domain-containing protein